MRIVLLIVLLGFIFNLQIYGITIKSVGEDESETAEPLEVNWEQKFHDKYFDGASQVVTTEDGGFLILGYYEFCIKSENIEYYSKRTWVIKIDESGSKLWEQKYPVFMGYNVILKTASDGSFLIGGRDLILRLDTDGSIMWNITLSPNNVEDITQISPDYILVSSFPPYPFLDLIPSTSYLSLYSLLNGTLVSSYSNLVQERAVYDIISINDTDSMLYAFSINPSNSDLLCLWIGIFNFSDIIWTQQCEFATNSYFYMELNILPSGNCFVEAYSKNDNTDVSLIYLSDTFEQEWIITFNETADVQIKDIIRLDSGNFIILGRTETFVIGSNVWVKIVNPEGDIIKEYVYDKRASDIEDLVQIDETTFLAVGCIYNYHSSSVWALEFSIDNFKIDGYSLINNLLVSFICFLVIYSKLGGRKVKKSK
ncbi:MAG: hypothetical protein ACTSXK_12360 [Promethearchaeota archaeon]